MEIREYLLSFSGYLQTPFDIYHTQVCSPIRAEYKLQDTLLKVVTLALGIIFYPTFGALYFMGRVIDWLIFQTVSPTPMHKKATPQETEEYQNVFKWFQEKTNMLLSQKTPPISKAVSIPSQEVLEVIDQAYDKRFHSVERLPIGVTSIRAGFHFCFFYEKTPDVVYKVLDSQEGYTKEAALAYVNQADRARQLCEEDNLFLLHIPQSIAVKLPNGTYAIVQEKVDIEPDFDYQRGLYRSLLASPDSEAYIRELHRQLAIFIAKFKFSDVKYNNIPITKDGYVALFDLDENGAIGGFLNGGARQEDGLLSDLPPTLQHEVLEFARPYLSSKEFEAIEAKMPAKKALSEKRWKKIHDYNQYAQIQRITTPLQKIKVEAVHLVGLSSKERTFALSLIKKINDARENHKDWPSLRMAGRVVLGTNTHDTLRNEMTLLFSKSEFSSKMEYVCEYLKQIGAIYSFKHMKICHALKIYS